MGKPAMSTSAPSALYGIYKQIKPHLSSMKIGGVVGDANHGSGYHISRTDLKAKGKSGDYSIQAPADKRGAANVASAIDITLSTAEMKTVTSRLRKACTPDAKGDYDPRIECVREFIGTLDSKNVCGYNRYKTGRATGWYSSGYSDSSHLWHVHISVFRAYNNVKNDMTGLAEVVAGLKAGELGWTGEADTTPAPVVVKPPVVKPTPPEIPNVPVEPPVVTPPVVTPPPVQEGTNVRIATWNTRRSSFSEDHGTARDWENRDELAKAFLLGIEGGTPGVILAQECTKEQTVDIAQYTTSKGVGNGLNGHPKDVSGDNTAVFVNADYTIKRVITIKSTTENPRFVTWVLLTRNGKTVWVGSTHLTAGKASRSLRSTEVHSLLKLSLLAGVDLKRAVFGGDINETVGNVRTVCAGYGLTDLEVAVPEENRKNWGTASFTGWDADQEQGLNIDALFIGDGIKARYVELVPVLNGASDHNMILAGLTL